MEATARPFGIKAISALYFRKSALVGLLIGEAVLLPGEEPSAHSVAAQLAPFLKSVHSLAWVPIAAVFVGFGVAVGGGIWLMKGWAWGLLMAMCVIPLVRLGQFLLIAGVVNRALLSQLPSSPLFAIDVVTSVLIVQYLSREDVKQLFGDRH